MVASTKFRRRSARPAATSAARQCRHTILAELRQDILQRRFALNSQLPTRTQIEQRFGASSVTVQRAIDQLRREGFVHVNGRQGTYVSQHPPHLYYYAMAFSCSPVKTGWTRFFQALVNEAAHYDGSEKEPRRISVHYGVENHPDNVEMSNLLAALRTHRLAGLILPEHPGSTGLAYTELGQGGDLRRVIFADAPFEGISAIHLEPFIDNALSYLATRGRRRIAVLSNSRSSSFRSEVLEALRAHGLTTQPYWLQMVSIDSPSCAREVTHLLLHGNQAPRPDALFVTDDNLVEYAIAGIMDAGLRVPDELEIVAHCNLPWPVPSVLPVKRLGYDAREVLAACLAVLEAQRLKQQTVVKNVMAVFEDDR